MATIAKADKGTSATPNKKANASSIAKGTSTSKNRPDSVVDQYLSKTAESTPTKRFKKKLVTKSEAATDSKNIKDTVTTIVKSKREVKYLYPEDIAEDAGAKKSFRAKARDKDKSFLKDIATLIKKKEDPTKMQKAYHTWRKSIFLVP